MGYVLDYLFFLDWGAILYSVADILGDLDYDKVWNKSEFSNIGVIWIIFQIPKTLCCQFKEPLRDPDYGHVKKPFDFICMSAFFIKEDLNKDVLDRDTSVRLGLWVNMEPILFQ